LARAAWPAGLFLCAATVSALGFAQDSHSSPPSIQEPLKVQSELRVVEVSVADARGNFRGDLKASQFRVFDDGAEQKIAYFDSVTSAAHIAVLVETSPAVYLISRQHLVAAYSLLDGLAPQDELALATYDTTTRLVLPFTADKAALAQTLDGLQYFLGMGDLNFYDAVNNLLGWLPPGPEKKAVIVLATGLDSSPPERWTTLQRTLLTSDVPVFTIALGGSLRDYQGKKAARAKAKSKKGAASDSDSDQPSYAEEQTAPPGAKPSFQRADVALREMAQTSGGRAYFPNSGDDFAAAYREIAGQLRNQYVLAYPPPAHDGRVHSLEVRIVDESGRALGGRDSASGLRVYARRSYLAPEK
jgi:VWFA-related protein